MRFKFHLKMFLLKSIESNILQYKSVSFIWPSELHQHLSFIPLHRCCVTSTLSSVCELYCAWLRHRSQVLSRVLIWSEAGWPAVCLSLMGLSAICVSVRVCAVSDRVCLGGEQWWDGVLRLLHHCGLSGIPPGECLQPTDVFEAQKWSLCFSSFPKMVAIVWKKNTIIWAVGKHTS